MRLCPKTCTLSTHQCDSIVCPRQAAIFINLPTALSKFTVYCAQSCFLTSDVFPQTFNSLLHDRSVCVFILPVHCHTPYFLSDPEHLHLTESVVCTMYWAVSFCLQMEDEDAGRKIKQPNGGMYEDGKHKKVERTQRWVRSHSMPLWVSKNIFIYYYIYLIYLLILHLFLYLVQIVSEQCY